MDHAELRYILGCISPSDATDQGKLDAACDYAIDHLDRAKQIADAEVARVMKLYAAPTNDKYRAVLMDEERALALGRALVGMRNRWLRENDGYRDMRAMG